MTKKFFFTEVMQEASNFLIDYGCLQKLITPLMHWIIILIEINHSVLFEILRTKIFLNLRNLKKNHFIQGKCLGPVRFAENVSAEKNAVWNF